MPDLAVVRQDVALGGNFATPTVKAGEAIEQGMPIRIVSDIAWQTQADSAVNAAATGIALTPAAAADDTILYVPSGTRIRLGVLLVVGTSYVVSANSGKIAPESDLLTGDFKTVLGIADNANDLLLRINASGVALP